MTVSTPSTSAVPPLAEQETGPLRCLSIDVEEYFQIEAAQGAIARADWERWPGRVERNVDRLLDLFYRHKRQGTFFILGWVARRHPDMVRHIAAAGHEIASHGMNHDRLHRLTPAQFRSEITECRKILQDLAQQPVVGFRAPTFSVVPPTAWALDVLVEAGFLYDSSIFQVRHPSYGVPGAPDRPYFVRHGDDGATLLEVPPLSWRVARRNVAVAGGGYFRLLPLWFMQRGLKQARHQDRPAILYFHPWEFDPQMPRMPLSFTGRLRTYTHLAKAAARLERIMAQQARWRPIGSVLEELKALARARAVFEL